MNKLEQLVAKLSSDYGNLAFKYGECFKWSPNAQTITIDPDDLSAPLMLLHEVAHALLEHDDYKFDIELLKKEVEAWDMVKTTLCPKYKINFDENLSEATIDTYREWLHGRSLCPNCHSTGSQSSTNGEYACPQCGQKWLVNDAKFTRLKRRLTK